MKNDSEDERRDGKAMSRREALLREAIRRQQRYWRETRAARLQQLSEADAEVVGKTNAAMTPSTFVRITPRKELHAFVQYVRSTMGSFSLLSPSEVVAGNIAAWQMLPPNAKQHYRRQQFPAAPPPQQRKSKRSSHRRAAALARLAQKEQREDQRVARDPYHRRLFRRLRSTFPKLSWKQYRRALALHSR